MIRLALVAMCASCATGAQPAPPESPRSVAEAIGLVDMAMMPVRMGCERQRPALSRWCTRHIDDELGAVWRDHGPYAVVGVAAHERGHLLGYPPPGAHGMTGEDAADAWAGCVLARLGFDLGPYLSLVEALDASDIDERMSSALAGAEGCSPKGRNAE